MNNLHLRGEEFQKLLRRFFHLNRKLSILQLFLMQRFSEIPYIMEGASNANDCPHHAVAGAKRKHEALEVDEELNSTIAENEVLWRANFEKCIFCLKKKFCAEQKKPKLKVGTHPIWEAFFEANVTDKDNNSVTSPINGVLEKLRQKEGGTSMTMHQITRVLEDLHCSPSTENPEAFTLNLSKIVEAYRNEEIESLVKKKYGQEAFTIFRLWSHMVVQLRQIKLLTRHTTILDKQIVHGTMYKLWKDEYIDTEGSKDETKLRNRKNILILALIRHDESLMLFHDF